MPEHSIRVKFELDRQFLVGRIPDGLVLLIASQNRRFHIISDHCPWHAIYLSETGDQATQERFLTHIRVETHIHVAAVFEPGGEEVARLWFHAFFAKLQSTHFPPIDL